MIHYPKAWLQGVSLGESIASELRLQIINGSIKPAEILSENRIASDFGTSRSPVREALKTLANEGLIRLERMGAVVLGLSMKDVEELYDVRYLIESFAQQRLAGGGHDELFVTLRQTIDKMELAARHRDVVDFAFQDFSFHEMMIKSAGHTRILHLWNNIRHLVMTVMLITTEEVFSENEQKPAAVVDKHRKILNGLLTRDVKVIQNVVEEYFADSRNTLHNSLPE